MKSAVQIRESSQNMFDEVIAGLSKRQKTLPSKYFYDKRGSELFEKICELEEYYPTRTELSIMRSNINEISQTIGNNINLLELGSGNSLKTRLLLDHLNHIESYIPVDISEEYLTEIVKDLQLEYPKLKIQPIVADYTKPFKIPENSEKRSKRIVYFPGSTIGNFTKDNAKDFIGLIYDLVGNLGGLLIGFDLIKDRQTLVKAYNDSQGVTAKFNKNILERINRDLGGSFSTDTFEHKALFNEVKSRIEMHLVSKTDQKVMIADREFFFEKDESIHTENSHKYSIESFSEMTEPYFKYVTSWTDPDQKFCVQFLSNASVKTIR